MSNYWQDFCTPEKTTSSWESSVCLHVTATFRENYLFWEYHNTSNWKSRTFVSQFPRATNNTSNTSEIKNVTKRSFSKDTSLGQSQTLSIFKPQKCVGSGGKAPTIIKLGAVFTHQPLYRRGKNRQYPLNRTENCVVQLQVSHSAMTVNTGQSWFGRVAVTWTSSVVLSFFRPFIECRFTGITSTWLQRTAFYLLQVRQVCLEGEKIWILCFGSIRVLMWFFYCMCRWKPRGWRGYEWTRKAKNSRVVSTHLRVRDA
jgi:hypothetical protein